MHFAAVLLSGLALAASAAHAIAPRTTPTETREFIDICARIDAKLEVDLWGDKLIVGDLDICLCLSALPLFLETNDVASIAVDLVGKTQVTSNLEGLIGSSQHVPACPSSTTHRKRDFKYWKKHAVCPRGQSACGVYGGSSRAYECVDTSSDLESCGGCSLQLNPLAPAGGKDCTSIHGVSDVGCVQGECVISRCMDGYEPSRDGTQCLRSSSDVQFDSHPMEDAFRFGLGNIPAPWKN